MTYVSTDFFSVEGKIILGGEKHTICLKKHQKKYIFLKKTENILFLADQPPLQMSMLNDPTCHISWGLVLQLDFFKKLPFNAICCVFQKWCGDGGENNDESGPLTFLLVLTDGVRGHKLALINDDMQAGHA